MDHSDIDSVPPPAVKNLRSKFEQLALDISPNSTKRPLGQGDLLIPEPSSPRPRAASGSYVNAQLQGTHHLRSSSSSSDLRTGGVKRPPPPPPVRGSKPSSPSPSPLLRPVPIPPNGSHHSPRTSSSNLPIVNVENELDEPPLSVMTIRNKFATPPGSMKSHSPSRRQSLVDLFDAPEPNRASSSKPPLPSRLPKNDESSLRTITTSPEEMSPPSSFSASSSHSNPQISLLDDSLTDTESEMLSSSKATPRVISSSLPAVNIESHEPSMNVSSLKNKFNSTPIHSPRQSISNVYPVIQSEPNLASTNKPQIPPVPPRPPRNSASPSRPVARSPEKFSHSSPSSRSSTQSPFSDGDSTDSEPTPLKPPALPTRKSQHRHQASDTPPGSLHFSDSSSSETSLNIKPSRPSVVPPPRPPPRYRSSALPSVDSPPATPQSTLSTAPPLPVRRYTVAQTEESAPISTPPRLPSRPSVPTSLNQSETDRKNFGSSRLPPPPTRTIALGDKLPAPRRPPTPSSDEESGEEEDIKGHGVDGLPDSSRSSRRPPTLSFRMGTAEPRIHVHAYTGHVSLSGTTLVVASQHHIRIYDLAISDAPIHTVDGKELGSKDIKVTSVEFRPSGFREDRGYLMWVGTKDGNLFELDIRSGKVVGSKHAAHLHAVTHILRYGRSMVTLDDSGKVLVFEPEDDSAEDVTLAYTQPRVVRIAEKQDFVKILGGMLWTAARGGHHGHGLTSKTPIIRLYDIFTPGSTVRSVIPTEHVGPVTSATIVPSDPGHVYVGHEEGFVTIWALETDDGFPQCVEVMKVSASDVLSLEGVNDRLWAGGRGGMITAYDVAHRPWIVTNCWHAHPGLPVLRLMVDHYGIEKTGRLCVVSVGRDEQLRLWDGLLGLDWVDQELTKQEASFSKFRDLSVLLVSWNVDAARPDSLTGDPANFNFLHDVLHSVDSPDIISFGFQEVIDLESRKMAAKNVLLGSKKKPEEGGLSEKVTGAYKRWYDCLIIAVRLAMPPECPYTVMHTESLVGLFTCIFVKNSERLSVKDMDITTVKRGMGGRYGNKGGIIARFVIEDSSICMINCHLAAGQNGVRQRNADVAGMLEEKSVFTVADHPIAYVGGGDGTMVLDHEIVFVNGDMNYRIDHRRDAIIAAIRSHDCDTLHIHDQLLREVKNNRGCRFRGFSEGPLNFLPTYKYDRRSNEYDSSEKRRLPAWCDRVLWRSRVPSRVKQLHYKRYEANVSDHRPISAAFTMTIKKFAPEIRERVKEEVQLLWIDEQARLLLAAKEFYIRQALL